MARKGGTINTFKFALKESNMNWNKNKIEV